MFLYYYRKWLAVSYHPETRDTSRPERGILIREKPYAQGLLRPIVNKKFLTSFDLTLMHGKVYQPLTDDPDNFVSLGGFHEYTRGHPVDIQNLVGVHKSICVRGELGEPVMYSFRNKLINSYSWGIASKEDTLDLSAITCSDNNDPRYESIWLLRKDFIEHVYFKV
jgi:hypothetical protein